MYHDVYQTIGFRDNYVLTRIDINRSDVQLELLVEKDFISVQKRMVFHIVGATIPDNTTRCKMASGLPKTIFYVDYIAQTKVVREAIVE